MWLDIPGFIVFRRNYEPQLSAETIETHWSLDAFLNSEFLEMLSNEHTFQFDDGKFNQFFFSVLCVPFPENATEEGKSRIIYWNWP